MSRRRKKAERSLGSSGSELRSQAETTCALVPLSPDELSRLERMRRNLIRGLVLITLTTAGMAAVLGVASWHATGSAFDVVFIRLLTLVVIAGVTEGRSQWRRIQRFGVALADRGKWVRHTLARGGRDHSGRPAAAGDQAACAGCPPAPHAPLLRGGQLGSPRLARELSSPP